MVRVSLFQFQDIITCVSGILIMISLLLATMVDETHESTPTEETKESAASAQSFQDLKAHNAVLRAQLEATADPGLVKAETTALIERLRVVAPSLDGMKSSRAAQAEAIKSKENTVGSLEKERAGLVTAVEALEKEIKDKQANLVENANTWWLVPKLSSYS